MKNKIKAIIFDFDGVIAESINVKTEAFAALYNPYGDKVVKKVVEHHLANGGISRFEKFKIYHSAFLGEEISEEKAQELARQFSDLVLNKVVNAPYVEGAYEFISANYKNYDFYISSGTPEKEIREIAKRRNIDHFFKSIFGSPASKGEHVQKIMKTNNYETDEVVFIGDAPSDREAAKENNIYFIARVDKKNSPLNNEEIKIKNLDNLAVLILKLN